MMEKDKKVNIGFIGYIILVFVLLISALLVSILIGEAKISFQLLWMLFFIIILKINNIILLVRYVYRVI